MHGDWRNGRSNGRQDLTLADFEKLKINATSFRAQLPRFIQPRGMKLAVEDRERGRNDALARQAGIFFFQWTKMGISMAMDTTALSQRAGMGMKPPMWTRPRINYTFFSSAYLLIQRSFDVTRCENKLAQEIVRVEGSWRLLYFQLFWAV